MDEFLSKLSQVLDVETLSLDDDLEVLEEWDSVAFVAFLSMAKADYDKKIDPQDAKAAKTVADLYKLLS